MMDLRKWNIPQNPGAKIFTFEDGAILTFMLSYILYRIIIPNKIIQLPSVEYK